MNSNEIGIKDLYMYIKFVKSMQLYFLRDRSLIMTWGGVSELASGIRKKKWPPYSNTLKTNDPPYGNTLKKVTPPGAKL